MARVGLFGIVFVLCLYAVIVTPLGLLTGGYLWAREVKECIFFGEMHEPKLSDDSKFQNKILKVEIDKLTEQNKEQIDELKEHIKEQINGLKKQNKEQMKQILDAVAGKNA
eukprot:scaffold2960_cov179-Chaetoceros_neogracile.AAC.4